MRTRVAIAALVVAAAVGLPGQTRATPSVVIRLVSTTTSNRLLDKAPRGASVGDKVFTTSRLANAVGQFGRAQGAVVGSDRGTLTIVAPRAVLADGTATLPGGTIRFHGRIAGQSAQTIPVVGGTGRFANARGTLTATPISRNGLKSSNVYRLRLP